MPGRFSANGDDWKRKVHLTQRFYSAALKSVPASTMDTLYTQHLLKHTHDETVFETMVSAAVAVVSRAYGLPHAIPWPADLIQAIRAHTVWLQAIGWVPGPAAWQADAWQQMQVLSNALFEHWSRDASTSEFVQTLAHDAGLSLRTVQQELLQNLFAATETTASSLCWMLEVLSRNEALCQLVTQADPPEQGRFIHESLRLFPPVPMVTRECTAPDPAGQDPWRAGQALVVSLVGLHTQASEWSMPLRFDHHRLEWQQDKPPPSFIPFLYGPRICGGRKLAAEELLIGLRSTLRHFRLEPVGDSMEFQYSLTSRPKHPPRLYRKSHG
jgi:cytochrome P450